MKFGFPFSALASRIEKNKSALPRRRKDFDLAVVINVLREDLRTDAGCVVNHFWNPLNRSSGLASEFETVQDRRVADLVFVVDVAVRPPAFAGHDAGHAVAVEVCEREGVKFSERDGFIRLFPILAVSLGPRGISHDQVARPCAFALRIALLLEPSQSWTMRVETRDHIGDTVAVDVINENVAAATQKLLAFGGTK